MKRKFKNSDGYHFHQYQQKEPSPLILTQFNELKKDDITLEIQVLVWDEYTIVAGFNRLMSSYTGMNMISSTHEALICHFLND